MERVCTAIISAVKLSDALLIDKLYSFEPQARAIGRVLTRKPELPSKAECAANPRSRSAKLRVFEKAAARVRPEH